MDRRELGIDLARGVAVVSMFVAHTAPGGGPGQVLQLTEFLTFPLFAMLVGVGAELGSRRVGAAQHAGASLVRAVVLLALGWALAEVGAQVVIVLAPLGLLTLLCWGLCRLPTAAVVGTGFLALLVAPWTVTAGEGQRIAALVDGDEWRLRLLELLVSPYYPQAVLVVAAVTGIVLVRVLLPTGAVHGRRPVAAPAALTGALLAGCVLLLVADRQGRVSLVAYETTWLEQVFVVALAAAVVTGGLALAALPVGTALQPLAWVGQMTLTLYVLQVLWLAFWVRSLVEPGQSDNSWVNVALLVAGSFVLAVLWRVAGPGGPFRRGPLEGLVGLGVHEVVRRVPASRIPPVSGAGVP